MVENNSHLRYLEDQKRIKVETTVRVGIMVGAGILLWWMEEEERVGMWRGGGERSCWRWIEGIG
jgi:hypothetical protein